MAGFVLNRIGRVRSDWLYFFHKNARIRYRLAIIVRSESLWTDSRPRRVLFLVPGHSRPCALVDGVRSCQQSSTTVFVPVPPLSSLMIFSALVIDDCPYLCPRSRHW